MLEGALATLRERRIHVSLEAELLQLLAETHIGVGQLGLARHECDEAIAAALRSGTPLYECDAQLILARILLQEGSAEPAKVREIGSSLERAAELIDQTGAESRRPRLTELLASVAHAQGDDADHVRKLREAHRLYVEMGATGNAARLGSELEKLQTPT